MAQALTATITNQRMAQAVGGTFTFTVGGHDYTDYLLPDWSISFNRQFGAAAAVFMLNNSDERFEDGGVNEINVGDVVSLVENFVGDASDFNTFYGLVKSRSIEKSAGKMTITLSCLDYISILQDLDISLDVEGTRVKVESETLTPNYLDTPNQDMAQLFNFANNSVATNPPPLIKIKDKNHITSVDSLYDGFEIYYDVGQLKLGSVLNVRNNYDVLATYYYYTHGVYAEDVIEAILTEPDGYGKYMFGEASTQAVIDNHLTENILNYTGSSTDILECNLTSKSLTVETTLVNDVAEGATSIELTDAIGFPTSGTGSINGDVFTWTGKSTNTLTGIPATGTSSLSAHNSGDYVEYTADYAAGQVWYLSYNNLFTTLTTSDFTFPGGSTVQYFDSRNGFIILDAAISVASVVTCDTNYSFNTLQATGIEINRIIFRKREVENRFDAVNKVREYIAPNYVINTKGDSKIWAMYLSQKITADYVLDLETNIVQMEDEDLFTRVDMWAKNENPTNLMFGTEVDYTSSTETSYTGTAARIALEYFGEEKSGLLSQWASDSLSEATLIHEEYIEKLINFVNELYIVKDYSTQSSTGKYVFGTSLTTIGKIILGDTIPIVYINDVPINNQVTTLTAMPVKIKSSATTTTSGGGKSKSVSVTTLYYYSVIFPHSSIVPNEPIYLYDNQGLLQYTIEPNDANVDYAAGIWTIPGIERNDVAEILSTASYKVLYSTDSLEIDYENAIIKIDKSILPFPEETIIRASFEYWAIAIAVRDIQNVVDGRRDTQLQIEFFGEPPSGFHLATIDLGASYNVQAIDIIGGFYKPDDTRKFDCNYNLTIQYSTDNINFYSISDKTENFQMNTGEAVTFEEEDLGSGFEARYLKFTAENVDLIDYGKGRYVVAITEISVYDDIVINSEATLIPSTTLSTNVLSDATTVPVVSTAWFTEPESTEMATAYIEDTAFTYTYLTPTEFRGCVGVVAANSGDRVSQTVEGDATLYDVDGLLPQLGDRVKHIQKISDRNLFSQSELDALAKRYLKEYYKNHSKRKVDILYTPYLHVGQTVEHDGVNYFIEAIENHRHLFSLVLARYP